MQLYLCICACLSVCKCLLDRHVAEAGLCDIVPAGLLGLCHPESITFHDFGMVRVGVDWGKEWWWWRVYTKSHPESAG